MADEPKPWAQVGEPNTVGAHLQREQLTGITDAPPKSFVGINGQTEPHNQTEEEVGSLMAEGEVKGTTAEENTARQQTGLTDIDSSKVTITNHEPVLTEQGQDTLSDMKGSDTQFPAWPKHGAHMTPQAQATLKAMRGH